MVFKRNNGAGRPGGKKFGGKPPFKSRGYGGRDGGFGGRDSGPRMHEAVCAACGKMAEVPFKPNGSKPIFCRDCFQQDDRAPREKFVQGAFGRSKFERKRTFDAAPRGDGQVEKQLQEMNAKLERIIRVLEEIKVTRIS